MAIWQQFPFTNFHQENIDWVLNSVKNLDERVDTLEASGTVTKDYVDVQDAQLDEKIVAERSARTTNDQILQKQITAHTTTIGHLSSEVNTAKANIGTKGSVPNFDTLWAVVGDYPATQSIGGKLMQVQTNEQTNSRAIAGTSGTYDFTKGTIQSRLNNVEGALQAGSLAKQNGFYSYVLSSGTANGHMYKKSNVTPFNFAVVTRDADTVPPGGDEIFFTIVCEPKTFIANDKYTGFTVELHCPKATIEKNIGLSVRTFTLVEGASGDQYATVSYVDEKNAELTTELGNVEAEVQDAYTMAETADTNATSAKTDASKAKSDASSALTQIGSKSSSVTFANLWATIGAWKEAVPMTERLNSAYSWSWNNRSAINGTADYPSDKATINARLTALEEVGNRQKIVSGSTTVTVTTGKETVIDYADAGFTAVPQVLVTYSTTGGNPSPTGIIKVFDKTKTGCKITISSGAAKEQYPIDWMATGT